VTALNNLIVQAKDINLLALGNVTIASGEDRNTRQWQTVSEDCSWYGLCDTTVTRGLEDKTSQVGSVIKGCNAVDVSAGKDLTTYAGIPPNH
jgi:hypothetical protein